MGVNAHVINICTKLCKGWACLMHLVYHPMLFYVGVNSIKLYTSRDYSISLPWQMGRALHVPSELQAMVSIGFPDGKAKPA